ncbi:MAG TPA: hypothetical protein VNI84_19940 [Pyrinomonadaceae bacterium]|nr:hypothetical protein [Pyrinomonadaceae bacterium]
MNFSENSLYIRSLILILAIGLLTTTLSAQTISQNFTKSPETKETRNKNETPDETIDKDKTPDDKTANDAKETEIKKQAEPKPPRFGGHVGVVIPIVTRGNGITTTIADDFIIGFPFALVVKTDSPVAFDFEFVPTINTPSNQDFRFLIHPGIVYAFNKKYLVGVRGAYEIGTGNYGFTPIAQRSFKLTKKTRYFIEADFPVRWERRPDRSRFASIQFAIHTGISF